MTNAIMDTTFLIKIYFTHNSKKKKRAEAGRRGVHTEFDTT